MDETQNANQPLNEEMLEQTGTAPVGAQTSAAEAAAPGEVTQPTPQASEGTEAVSAMDDEAQKAEAESSHAPSQAEAEVETAPEEETASDEEAEKEEEPSFNYTQRQSKGEIIERLKELLDAEPQKSEKQELDALKQNFYKLHKAQQAAARKEFVEAGGQEEQFVPAPDAEEEEYKALMKSIKERRSALHEEEEKRREANLAEKQQILEQLKAMVESSDVEKISFNDFRALQQRWKEIKEVPQAAANDLWKQYQLYSERFYDILKLNNEFREYDFKKNLAAKTLLCEEAEKLTTDNDLVGAFRKLQKLHQEWAEAGPVAKELRESLWARFKAASTTINRRHQQHFEQIKAAERMNLDQKTVICEIVEGIEYDALTNFQLWNEKTKEVIALQAKWKTIGFAPQKMNLKIFERFRAACDEFFRRKSEFFKGVKEGLNANLEKKRALCEKAEQLKDSTDWKETTAQLTQMQKEWKSIGPVPKKYSDALWRRFIEACDHFFEEKGKATSSQYSAEAENLKKKQEIVEQLRQLAQGDESEATAAEVSRISAAWNAIGYVPFKEKDKINKEYRELINSLYDRLHLSETSRRLSSLRGSKGGENRERERLTRMYDNMRNEILTYENNIGFLNTSSKKGDSLVAEIQRKVERLKADAELVLKKIKELDASEAGE